MCPLGDCVVAEWDFSSRSWLRPTTNIQRTCYYVQRNLMRSNIEMVMMFAGMGGFSSKMAFFTRSQQRFFIVPTFRCRHRTSDSSTSTTITWQRRFRRTPCSSTAIREARGVSRMLKHWVRSGPITEGTTARTLVVRNIYRRFQRVSLHYATKAALLNGRLLGRASGVTIAAQEALHGMAATADYATRTKRVPWPPISSLDCHPSTRRRQYPTSSCATPGTRHPLQAALLRVRQPPIR